jgi:hypothetical protein
MNKSAAVVLCRQQKLPTVYLIRAELIACLSEKLIIKDGAYHAEIDVDHLRRQATTMARAAVNWLNLLNSGEEGVAAVRAKMDELADLLKITSGNGFGAHQTKEWRALFNQEDADEWADEDIDQI